MRDLASVVVRMRWLFEQVHGPVPADYSVALDYSDPCCSDPDAWGDTHLVISSSDGCEYFRGTKSDLMFDFMTMGVS